MCVFVFMCLCAHASVCAFVPVLILVYLYVSVHLSPLIKQSSYEYPLTYEDREDAQRETILITNPGYLYPGSPSQPLFDVLDESLCWFIVAAACSWERHAFISTTGCVMSKGPPRLQF